MRSLVWLVAVTAACGSVNKTKPDAAPPPDVAIDAPPDPLNGAKSGTRLKLKWFVFEDGTKQINGFHDTQLDVDCNPSSFYGDTHMYCMPQGASVNYTDAACTAKVALVYNYPCATQQYTYTFAAEAMSMNCTYGVTHLYHLGSATTAANYYYKDSTGACQGPYSTSGYTPYTLGAEVTTSGLAEVTASTPTAGALGLVSLQSSDGLNYPQYMHDSAGGFDCYPSYNYQGATSAQCFPNNTNYAGYYSDATCATNEALVGPGCMASTYAYQPTKNQCSTDPYDIHHVGSAITPTPANYYYWNASAQTCNAQTPPTGYSFYNIGASITMQTLTRAHDTIPGHRIQGIQMAAGEARIRDYTLYDTTLGTECYVQQMSDGTYRCLPENAYIQTNYYYTDAACTTYAHLAQIYKGGVSTCASQPAPTYAYEQVPVGQCYAFNIYQVGAKYTGTIYWMNGTCQPYPYAGQSDYYMTGPQVPVVGLAPATLQNDP